MSKSFEMGLASSNRKRSRNPPGMASVALQRMNGEVRDRALGHEAEWGLSGGSHPVCASWLATPIHPHLRPARVAFSIGCDPTVPGDPIMPQGREDHSRPAAEAVALEQSGPFKLGPLK